MTKPLLAIISCPKDNALVTRHWPWFKKSGCDIVGCGSKDGETKWPEDIPVLNTGEMGLRTLPIGGTAIWGLLQQELDILEAFIGTDYKSVAIVEADNLIVRPFPAHPGKLLLAPIVPNLSPHFTTPVYFSTPRYYDRETAGHVLHHAKDLLRDDFNEHWCSDRFVALAAFRARVRYMNFGWTQLPVKGPGDKDYKESFIRDARVAISLGFHSIHGVKTDEQLKAITA